MQRDPAAVTARSITARRLPRRSPARVRLSSRLARVAGSMSRTDEATSRRGGRRCGTFPAWVITMYSRRPPNAETSARENAPKPSSALTSNCSFSRRSAASESKRAEGSGVTGALVRSRRPVISGSARSPSAAMISRGSRRMRSADSRAAVVCITASSPELMSAQAMAISPVALLRVTLARKLWLRESSRLSSVSVPGVTRRTTSRFTTALEPRLRASAGSSICSQTATRWPMRISFCR